MKRKLSPSRTEAFRLLKVLSRVLESEVRRQIIAEVQRHVATDDPIFLASWLRNTYMAWLPNVPLCHTCGAVMEAGRYELIPGSATRFEPDASHWTGYSSRPGRDPLCRKVERYACLSCHRVRTVSRSNDVLEILVSRTGRCGEFAIAYTSILLALGYHARLMFTLLNDHLWTEVRIGSKWVPVDVAAEDVQRLIKDRFLFERWGWKLGDLYAIEPGKMPLLDYSYRTTPRERR